ncbi:hypothetical protein [Undibacterium sp. SXout20W]|uniref:hypothetical protein n=1 Tax=Undibacterium sp. SXout20W TaxID=3413051 RepID=UPI003BF33A30
MFNKKIRFSLISIAVLMLPALFLGNAYAMASLSIPQAQQEHTQTEPVVATAVDAPPTANTWDRSGVDRASVHLQILMQSNNLFTDSTTSSATQKKPSVVAKKNQTKPANNS